MSRRGLGVATVLLVALGVAAPAILDRLESRAIPTTPSSSAGAQATAPAFSIAVLQFENQSGNPDNDYFAAGLTSELSRLLARVRGLRVTDATAAIRKSDATPTAPELARRLGVRWLLRGAVRESGERIRISVELIRAQDAVQRWSEVYDRRKGDVFALQDDIAAAVIRELRPRLEGEMPRAYRTDANAYGLYLRAQYFTMRTSPAGLSSALQLYRQAAQLAPNYAAAWEGIARVYQQQAGLQLRPAGEAFELARAASARAIAVDPRYGLAHARLGAIALFRDGNMALAARHMQRGYDLDPGHQLTNGNLSILLRSMGRIDAAIAYGNRADRMDPLNPRGMLSSAYLHLLAGNLALANTRVEETIALSPDFAGAHYMHSLLLLLRHRPGPALLAAEREPVPAKRFLAVALAAHSLGRAADADAALRQLEALHAQRNATAYALACGWAWRGERDQAFSWLERAASQDEDEYDPDYTQVLVDPLLQSLHADPRWSAFLARIGRAPEQLAPIEVRAPKAE